MNERVWLQADTSLVNKFRDVGLAFLATFVVVGCSGESTDENTLSDNPSNSASVVSVGAAPQLARVNVIWGAQETEGYVTDLAIGQTSGGAPLVLARTQTIDGKIGLHAYDMDGAKTASSQGIIPELSQIRQGFTATIDSTAFSVHPFLQEDVSKLAIALVSPALGVIGTLPVPDSPDAATVCTGFEQGRLVYVSPSGQALETAQLTIAGETANLEPLTRHQTGQDIKSCTVSDALAVVVHTNGASLLDLNDGVSAKPLANQPASASLVEYDQRPLLVMIDQSGTLATDFLDTATPACPVRLGSGLTVKAPDRVSSFAVSTAVGGVDYPKGLVALTGHYDDGDPRISYFSLQDLVQACDADPVSADDASASP